MADGERSDGDPSRVGGLPLATWAGFAVATGAGTALASLAGVSRVDAYLATTPGGLYAVLATALGGGANTTFILAVQTLRLLTMVLAAPALTRRLSRPMPAR